jgi:hypothetical protein
MNESVTLVVSVIVPTTAKYVITAEGVTNNGRS